MSEKITAFLDEVCSHIKYKKIHGEIRAELTEHILDRAEDIGVEEAILQMGDTVEIGERLNSQHKPQTEWSIIALGAVIALIGGFIMYASSKFEPFWAVNFERYIFCVIIGLAVLVGFYFFDYTKLQKLSLLIYFAAIALLFILMPFYHNGNGRLYIRIGSISVSIEYMVFLFVIAFAGLIERYRGQGGFSIIKLIILGTISLLSILFFNNMSLAFIMLICYAVLILTAVMRNHFGGNRKTQLISLGILSGTTVSLFILYVVRTHNYLIKRIIVALSRGQSDPDAEGWLHVMIDKLLSLSNWFGMADTVDTWYGTEWYLPDSVTNHVLINLIVTFGWAVGIALIVCVALFIIRMFMTVSKVKNDYGFYLSLAACVILSSQFIINILMNFSFLPMTGIGLPFVSYGGTSYIISMALLGLILSVWRRNNLVSRTVKVPSANRGKLIQFHDGKLIINLNKHIVYEIIRRK